MWSRGAVLSSDLAGKDYFSIAILPDAKRDTLELFRQHAYAFVTGSEASYRYDEPRAELETTFQVHTAKKEEGTSSDPLIALYRHQWLHTDAKLLPSSTHRPRGSMKLLPASSFRTRIAFSGVLPLLPNVDASNQSELMSYVNRLARSDDFVSARLRAQAQP